MSLPRSLASAALTVALVSSRPGSADPTSTSAACAMGRGSLALAGCRLAEQLLPVAKGASVRVVELKTDRDLPSPQALRDRVEQELAMRLAPAGLSRNQPKLEVELRIEKSGGVLRFNAELRRAVGLWQRTRHRKPVSEQHAFVEVPLDAELRALIPPPPLVVSETIRLKSPERGVVALSCGALGSDGGQELVVVSRSSVRVGRVAGKAFVERKRAVWSALSPVAPAPLREPIASVEVTPRGTLRLGSSDRRDGLELSSELAVVRRFNGGLPLPGAGCLARSGIGFSAANGDCEHPLPSAAVTLDAVAGAGGTWLGREVGTSNLWAEPRLLVPEGLRTGAQLALGDADGDGSLELAYSADTLEVGHDRVAIATIVRGKLVPRFSIPAPAISAIAICNRQEGPGMAPIVLASGEELWLVR